MRVDVELTEREQAVGNEIARLCEDIRDEAVEHILATGLMAFAEVRGSGVRLSAHGWTVLVERSERIHSVPR